MASVDLSSVTDTFLQEIDEEGADDLGASIKTPDIYGREKETALLRHAYERVTRTRESQTVLVHGLSGQGKTALIEGFRERVCAAGGLFCGAKYFQNSAFQEPHSAIVAAFSDLCDLVSQSTTFTDERKQQIRMGLGSEGGILKKVISNISPFLEESTQSDAFDNELKSDAMLALFRVACKKFLRAMTNRKESVVVFLDDIQWMDDGSKSLIKMYVSDSELKNVMFILSYRDEEEACVKKIFANVNRREEFVDIPVVKLNNEDVAAMVTRILHRPDQIDTADEAEKGKKLVDMVYQKTNGNPFYVIQFMDTIQLEGLLKFDSDLRSWIFDVQEIQREIMVASGVAELLLRKIRLLPRAEQEALKIASLMGYDFEESVLFKIIQEERRRQSLDSTTNSTIALSLSKVYELGLVERMGDSCNFPHDKIQSAFQSMISKDEVIQLQSIIGETYLSLENEDSVYRAALHLNQTLHVMHRPEDRLRLARINVDASHFASDRSAFDLAAEHLRQSLHILDMDERDKWSNHFDLAFEVTENLARMELIVGNLDRCKELTEEALSRARTLDMKVKSLVNAVECRQAGVDLIGTAGRALATLGVKFPERIQKHQVVWKFLTVRKLLRGKTDEEILQLPPMEEEVNKAASRILMNICLHAAQQYEQLTYIYVALVAFELTLKYGLSAHSPTYVMIFGMAELHLKNYSEANRFARLGKRLLDQMQSKITECSAYFLWGTVLAHWTEPLVNLREPLERGLESGIQSGDIMFTPIAMGSVFALRLILGCNLQDLKHFMHFHYTRLCDLSQDAMLVWVQPCFQVVINLQSESSDWNDLTSLTGDIMHEEEYFRKTADLKNHLVAATALSLKAFLAFHFGFVHLSISAYQKMENFPANFFDTYAAISRYFYSSLAYYEHYRKTGKGRHFRTARKWQRSLERVQARDSPNARILSLVQAEEKSFRKRVPVDILISCYDAAIAHMSDDKCGVQYSALANERAGFVLVEKNMHKEARKYFDRALELYSDWGAFAKYGSLQERVSVILSRRECANRLSPQPPRVVGGIQVEQ